MKIISETETLTTVRLSDAQKIVLTKIMAAATPESALFDISDGRNLVANRNILAKLGLITFTSDSASVTDEGKAVMKDENLIDDSDQLTPVGEKFAQAEHIDDVEDVEQGMAPPDEGQPKDEFSFGDEQGSEESGEAQPEQDLNDIGESFGLLREIAHKEYVTRKINEMNQAPHFGPGEIQLIKRIAAGSDEDLNSDLEYKITKWVMEYDPQWMPYETQKARRGTPSEWIYDHIDEIANILTRT